MASTSTVTEVTGTLSAKQAERATKELGTRLRAFGRWSKVSESLGGINKSFLWQVAHGQKPPSRRLLIALGIVKPEKRNDIRIRMTLSDAREIVEHDTMPANVKNRIRYAMWGRK